MAELKRAQTQSEMDARDTTWEPLAECKDLEALDLYLELQGVAHPRDLPKCI